MMTPTSHSQAGNSEELLDELNLTPNIVSAQPAHLPFPDHVYSCVALNGSPAAWNSRNPSLRSLGV
jgi:hypothetical protein